MHNSVGLHISALGALPCLHATTASPSIIIIIMLILHFGWAFIVLAPGVLYYIVISVKTTMVFRSDESIVSVQRLGSTQT